MVVNRLHSDFSREMHYNIHIVVAVYLTNWKNMHYFDDLFDSILAVNVVVLRCACRVGAVL